METKIGNVNRDRYEALVQQAHTVVETLSSCQFELGDIALEIEPIQRPESNGPAAVYNTLRAFADEISIDFITLLDYRMVASAWPKGERPATKSPWTIYKTLAHLPGRFEVIQHPPRIRVPVGSAGPATLLHELPDIGHGFPKRPRNG